MTLKTRTLRFHGRALKDQPKLRGFHAPQRERAAKVQHPKPMCGMCGGKVHTRTDFRARGEFYDPQTGRTGDRPGDPGWWLCKTCDTGAEVGMPRAA